MRQVVAALIVRDDTVLICQRTKYQPMALKWEFPGGKIEPGEEARAALRRELDEELGIRAEIGDEVTRIKHTYRNGGAIELRFYLVKKYEGELENRIFKDIVWAKLTDLPSYDFLEADIKLVNDIAAGKVI
jgi:8-oxo-dGTP diphosphatase